MGAVASALLAVPVVVRGADAPSAAVRTITPCASGFKLLMMGFRRRRSASGSRRLIPETSEFGARTRKRPGREICAVSRAPLPPIGSFVTCTRTDCPLFSTCSMADAPSSKRVILPSTCS